jgi:hypothetical protein
MDLGTSTSTISIPSNMTSRDRELTVTLYDPLLSGSGCITEECEFSLFSCGVLKPSRVPVVIASILSAIRLVWNSFSISCSSRLRINCPTPLQVIILSFDFEVLSHLINGLENPNEWNLLKFTLIC